MGLQARDQYTAQEMLRLGKGQMARVLNAYEHALPGSAAERLQQREDLEAMLHQLEQESASCAEEALAGGKKADLRGALRQVLHKPNTASRPKARLSKQVMQHRQILAELEHKPMNYDHVPAQSEAFSAV